MRNDKCRTVSVSCLTRRQPTVSEYDPFVASHRLSNVLLCNTLLLCNALHAMFSCRLWFQNEPVKVCVTGAAGQIAYSLLYSIAKGDVFGREQVGNTFI